jgi:adenylate kinase family enzyme
MSELSYSPTLFKKKAFKFYLIGMSGAGKSHWSKKMESLGFQIYSCDDLIAERLGQKLEEKGKSTINLAKWMGQPFSEGYPEAEAFYLELEGAVISQICDELENSSQKDKQVVVDTTGSLIYLENKLLNRLRNLTLTVQLKLPEEKHEKLFETYLLDPKPVIWGEVYLPREGESPQNTLGRCYRELLSFRNERYGLLADCVLDYSFHHCTMTGPEELLELVTKNYKMKP